MARESHLASLDEITRIALGTHDFPTMLDALASRLADLFGADSCYVAMWDQGTERVSVRGACGDQHEAYLSLRPEPGEATLTEAVLQAGRALAVDDVQNTPCVSGRIAAAVPARSVLALPLIADQQMLGAVVIASHAPRQWSPEEIARGDQIAGQLSLAVARARALEIERRRGAELEVLRQASLDLTSSLELPQVLQAILEHVFKLVDAADAHIFLYDGEKLTFGAALWADGQQGIPYAEPRPEGLTYTVARTGRRIVVPDVNRHPLYEQWPWGGAIAGLPLRIGERVMGVMTVAFQQVHPFAEEELRVLGLLADQAAVAIENAYLLEAARRRAAHQEVLNAITAAATAAIDLSDLLEIALQHALHALNVAGGTMWIGEQEATQGLAPTFGPACRMACQAERGPIWRTLAVEDWREHDASPSCGPLATVLDSFGICASLSVPLVADAGQQGGLIVVSHQPRSWSADEIALLEAIAQQLSGATRRFRLLQQVQEQAQQVQRIMDIVPEGVLLLDAGHRVLMANPAGQEYLYLLTGQGVGDVLTTLADQPLERFLLSGSSTPPMEVLVESPLQRVFEVQTRVVEVGAPEGGWTLFIREATAVREMQQRIRRQERLAALGQLAAGIAHDFNNLLQGIMMCAGLLLESPDMPAALRETVQTIVQQGNRGGMLVRQILDLGRRSVGLHRRLDLARFLPETIKLLRHTIPQQIQVAFSQEPGPFVISADPIRIEQIVANLMVNARDAMPGGGELRFHLARRRFGAEAEPPFPTMPAGEWLILRVSDTGEGIPGEILPRVFDPFFTTKEVGKGTGLGLAQVYGIVEQHGGYVDVESQVGGGATFNIYMPLLGPGESTSQAGEEAAGTGPAR